MKRRHRARFNSAGEAIPGTEAEYIQRGTVPGIRIFRGQDRTEPFDIFFCKTKYNVYTILMGLEAEEVESRMAERSRGDLEFLRNVGGEAAPPAAGLGPVPA